MQRTQPAADRIMRKIIALTAIIFIFLMPSCTNRDTELSAIQEAEDAGILRDSIENEMVETLDEINRNLDLIRERQGLISSTGSENISKKQNILENMSMINALIEDNRRKIDELTIQARNAGKEKNILAKIADQTRARIIKQEEEITDLKSQLEKESFKVADLNRKLDEMQMNSELLNREKNELSEGNAMLDKDLHSAYFAYGTYEELKEKKLVQKTGGFLGVGKKDELATAFYKNKSYFTPIDIRETMNIPIHGKRPKLVTSHPQNSYEWKQSGEKDEYMQLLIKDPEAFWSTSRFFDRRG